LRRLIGLALPAFPSVFLCNGFNLLSRYVTSSCVMMRVYVLPSRLRLSPSN
jgi:hypothetical protein